MEQVKVIIEKSSYGFSAYMGSGDEKLDYGILGEGKTAKDAIEDFKDAYEDMKEYYRSVDKPFVEAEFEFYFDTASFIQYYAYAFSLAGLERITGVNQKQLGHYLSGLRKPSAKTVRKIEDGIKKFTQELSAVHFV